MKGVFKMHYVTTDIHGEYDLLIKLIETIELKKDDVLYILGDLVDRGPDSLKVVELVRKTPNILTLMGNHELMMKEALKSNIQSRNPLHIFDRYAYGQFILEYSKDELLDLVNWMGNLPYFFEYDNYVMVHSGLSVDPKNRTWEYNKPLQEEDDFLWSRADFYNYPALSDKIVLFGHTPTCYLNKDERFQVWNAGDKIGLDCGATFAKSGGQLACFCIETGAVTYVK